MAGLDVFSRILPVLFLKQAVRRVKFGIIIAEQLSKRQGSPTQCMRPTFVGKMFIFRQNKIGLSHASRPSPRYATLLCAALRCIALL